MNRSGPCVYEHEECKIVLDRSAGCLEGRNKLVHCPYELSETKMLLALIETTSANFSSFFLEQTIVDRMDHNL